MNSTQLPDELVQAREKLLVDPEALIQLRPLPAVAMRVSQACEDENVSTRDLAELVECDPAFTSKILSVVNSSLYGFKREISSINQALVTMGRKNVVRLALSIAAKQVFSSGDSAAEARKMLFEHSLGCAAVAKSIVENIDIDVEDGTAFLAGILHDVGKLVLLDLAPTLYSEQLLETPDLQSSTEMEQHLFGVDHSELGDMFGRAWGLPATIRFAVAHHHVDDADEYGPLSRVIYLANQLTRLWGFGYEECDVTCDTVKQWLAGNDPTQLESIREEAEESFKAAKQLFAS